MAEILDSVFVGGIGFKESFDQWAFHRMGNNLPEIFVIEIADSDISGPVTALEFLAQTSLHVFRKVVDVIFGLPKGDLEHEFTLGRVFKPERRKLEKEQMFGV